MTLPSAELLQLKRIPKPPPIERPALAHYDYDDLDGLDRPDTRCVCTLCFEVRTTYENYRNSKIMCRKHGECDCYICRDRDENRTLYYAAITQRETYSELSYLTREHKLAPQFLNWVYDKIMDIRYHSKAWWAGGASTRPLAEWMIEWQTLYLPRHTWAVSGLF